LERKPSDAAAVIQVLNQVWTVCYCTHTFDINFFAKEWTKKKPLQLEMREWEKIVKIRWLKQKSVQTSRHIKLFAKIIAFQKGTLEW